jgi:hypothetical protein
MTWTPELALATIESVEVLVHSGQVPQSRPRCGIAFNNRQHIGARA